MRNASKLGSFTVDSRRHKYLDIQVSILSKQLGKRYRRNDYVTDHIIYVIIYDSIFCVIFLSGFLLEKYFFFHPCIFFSFLSS